MVFLVKINKSMTNMDSDFKKAWYFLTVLGVFGTLRMGVCDKNIKKLVFHCQEVETALIS